MTKHFTSAKSKHARLLPLIITAIIGLAFPIAFTTNAQCVQATSHSVLATPLLASVTDPQFAYDGSDGDLTTAATMTVDTAGQATLYVNFDNAANAGDSIIVFFGVPSVQVTNWASFGKVIMTPYSEADGTGTPSTGYLATQLNFVLVSGANSVARVAMPVTAAEGARSLKIDYVSLGSRGDKSVFIYDVGAKAGPVNTSGDQAVCEPGGSATFTASYNALPSRPVDITWYGPDGMTVLQVDQSNGAMPYVSTFVSPSVSDTTTYFVGENWAGCPQASDLQAVTLAVRPPITPDISITCDSVVTLSTTTTGAEGTISYQWLASNGGNIVSGDDSATPSINSAGDYQVTLTDANGCTGTTTEAFSETDCAKLPVVLVSFSAHTGEGNVHLEWQTILETNSNRFEIQRSYDAKRWTLAGSLPTREDGSTSLKTYTFLDTSPTLGLNYYRLKMIDNDNTFAYSGIREVRVDAEQKLVTIYPNPAKETLNLNVPAKTSVKSTHFFDMKGVLVLKGNPAPSVGISLKNLAPGSYVLQILKTNGKAETHIVIVGR